MDRCQAILALGPALRGAIDIPKDRRRYRPSMGSGKQPQYTCLLALRRPQPPLGICGYQHRAGAEDEPLGLQGHDGVKGRCALTRAILCAVVRPARIPPGGISRNDDIVPVLSEIVKNKRRTYGPVHPLTEAV